MNKRQKFYTENQYKTFLKEYEEVLEFCKTNTFQASSPEQEASLRAGHLQNLLLDKILACYTAGEEVEVLIPLLEELVEKYEIWQKKLAIYEQAPKISPLAIDDWPDQYEECVQVISLCILLHRTDLLKRFVSLIDEAGYAGDDTLYEDLLGKVLPNRHDVDRWYHDVYTPLVQAIYADTKEKASGAPCYPSPITTKTMRLIASAKLTPRAIAAIPVILGAPTPSASNASRHR